MRTGTATPRRRKVRRGAPGAAPPAFVWATAWADFLASAGLTSTTELLRLLSELGKADEGVAYFRPMLEKHLGRRVTVDELLAVAGAAIALAEALHRAASADGLEHAASAERAG
jgi:hypothetical protein